MIKFNVYYKCTRGKCTRGTERIILARDIKQIKEINDDKNARITMACLIFFSMAIGQGKQFR